MKVESRASLEAILEGYNLHHPKPGTSPPPVSGSEVQFAVAFERVREEVILPVLREFAAILEMRGHPCELTEEETPGHHVELATIGIRLFPSGLKGAPVNECPSLTFFPDSLNEKVVVTLSNLGPCPGPANCERTEYRLDQVTSVVVEAQVLRLLQGVFNA